MIDENRYSIYQGKDRRYRVYDKQTQKVFSYPRLLMEEKLGRPLAANEQVHHIDGDYTNNSIENLEVLLLGEHQKQHTESICKYKDVEKECAYCHQKFIWKVSAQKNFYANVKRGKSKTGPYCSRQCAGKGSSLANRAPSQECDV